MFNAVAGLLFGIPISIEWFKWLVSTMQICILVSCGFLIDAFRILKKFKGENQAISKKQVALLSIAFGLFGLNLLVTRFFAFLKLNVKPIVGIVQYALFELSFFLSCLTLTILLQNLT